MIHSYNNWDLPFLSTHKNIHDLVLYELYSQSSGYSLMGFLPLYCKNRALHSAKYLKALVDPVSTISLGRLSSFEHFVGMSNLTAGNFLFGLASGSGFSFLGFRHKKWSLQTLEDFFGIHILPFGFFLLMALAHRVRASLFLRSVGKANRWNGGSQSHSSFSRIHLCALHIEDDHLLRFFPLFGQPTTAQDRYPNPISTDLNLSKVYYHKAELRSATLLIFRGLIMRCLISID